VLGIAKDLFGRAGFGHDSAIEELNAIGHVARETRKKF
jgi:hypothetical protein